VGEGAWCSLVPLRPNIGPHKTIPPIYIESEAGLVGLVKIFDTDRVYFIRVDGNKMMVKSPGVIVPMTGATSIVEFELVRSD
jgi:hypothetical protein